MKQFLHDFYQDYSNNKTPSYTDTIADSLGTLALKFPTDINVNRLLTGENTVVSGRVIDRLCSTGENFLSSMTRRIKIRSFWNQVKFIHFSFDFSLGRPLIFIENQTGTNS